MNSRLLNLRYVLNIEKWEIIQDYLSAVTGLAMITVDYKGVPLTKHSMCCDFCKVMRNKPDIAKHCQKCDSRAGLEAVRINKPYVYFCHCNIIDVAIPIIIDDKYIGAVMAGQVQLADSENAGSLERMYSDFKLEEQLEHNDELKRKYNKIKKLPYGRIKDIADMLWHISNYIIEEAITRNMLYEINQRMKQEITESINYNDLIGYPVDLMNDIKNQIKWNDLNSVSDKPKEAKKTYNSVLKPAIDYINTHIKENITLDEMAKLCNVSSSYFSKLFTREMGENFSSYLSKAKISLAKSILETTDIPISELAYCIGFNDCGYFIKQFKKHEGVTPAVYRKYTK